MKKILLIEDNRDISNNIKNFLEINDFIVKQIWNGEAGLNEILINDYDLVLLDIGLPKSNGFLVCQKALEKKEVPIIFITAKEFIEDKIFGLRLGAKDYLIKPFDLRELLIRIEIHLKNKKIYQSEFKYNDIFIDFKNRIFKKGENEINLSLKEGEILKIIVDNGKNLSPRNEIIEKIWGDKGLFDSDAKLDVYISNLRNKFGKEFIKTIKGIGYKIG